MTDFPLRVDLPKGHWAELRDPEDVTERQRRQIRTAQLRLMLHAPVLGRAEKQMASVAADTAMSPEVLELTKQIVESGAFDASQEASTVALSVLVGRWSFDFPVNADTILDLPGPAYDALWEAARPLAGKISPDFDPSPDPDSPTRPSSD